MMQRQQEFAGQNTHCHVLLSMSHETAHLQQVFGASFLSLVAVSNQRCSPAFDLAMAQQSGPASGAEASNQGVAPGAPGSTLPIIARRQARWRSRSNAGRSDSSGVSALGQPSTVSALGQAPEVSALGQASEVSALGQASPATAAATTAAVPQQLNTPALPSPSSIGLQPKHSGGVSRSKQSEENAHEQQCRRSAATIAKYTLFKRVVHCCERGVDRLNRDGMELNGNDVHRLATKIRKIGCDVHELERCICVQLSPGDVEERGHNQRLCAKTPLFPQMDANAWQNMSMTTLVGSHANYVSRCYFYGVTCHHPEHSSGEGCMNLAYVKEVDPAWADAIQHGTMTTVLSHVVRIEDVAGMMAVIAADNLKHGANLVEHSLQLLRRMVNYCKAEEALARVVLQNSIVRRFLSDSPMETADAECYFAFASRLGSSPAMSDLERFRTHYMSDGTRDVQPEFYGKIASLPLGFSALSAGLIKAQLTCPDQHMVKHICKFINIGDVETLREGKQNHKKAVECQNFLIQFRDFYAEAIAMLGDVASTRILALLDSQAVRILMGRKCKYSTYEQLANAVHDHIRKDLDEELGLHAMPGLGRLYASASSVPDQGSASSVLDQGVMVKYKDGEVARSFVCQERGISAGAYLVCNGDVSDERVKPGNMFKITSVSDTHVQMTNVEDKMEQVVEVEIDSVLRCMEHSSGKGQDEYLATPDDVACPKWLPDKTKLVLWLAMQHAASSNNYKIFERSVRIRIKPRVGVYATEDLRKDACFPILSSNIIACAHDKMTTAAYKIAETLFVVPTRPSVRKINDTDEVIWNPGSAIRLVSSNAKRSDVDSVNSEMVKVTTAVVTSCRGSAREEMAVMPAIVLTKAVEANAEIVCLLDPEFYCSPPEKPKRRFGVLQPKPAQQKALKKVKSDPMTVVK